MNWLWAGLVALFALSKGSKKAAVSKGRTKTEQRVLSWSSLLDPEIEKWKVIGDKLYKLLRPLVYSTVEHESGGFEKVKGPTGDGGLFQFIIPTATTYGLTPEERFDAKKAIPAGVKLLVDLLLKYKDTPDPLAYAMSAYNAGSGTVKKYYPEIRNKAYVEKGRKLFEKWKAILQK